MCHPTELCVSKSKAKKLSQWYDNLIASNNNEIAI